ncbi:MAG: CoB--CoM heterodisulfide reductase iron-sulfur subunit B family protein [Desulfobacterales bacterium]|nr:CoB--CoM heterodisulfide reductase iron-sulfur subunit B family protein [Desulfobacterales bacterium]
MKYLYYPGCSLEASASEYDRSSRAFLTAMGAEITELTDWNCCGASAAEAQSRLLALALPARNLAIAEKMGIARDLLVPCSACYLNLRKVTEKIRREPDLLAELNTVLSADGLHLSGGVRVRHLLDVVATDLGAQGLRARVSRPLKGLTIAPYYGCQCLRPYKVFDDPEAPQSMSPLIEAAGAAVHPWQMGARCCSASLMTAKPEVGIALVADILTAARGADAIATVCPMCQMNLEAFQAKASRFAGENLAISVLYLPQLLGLAMGLGESEVGLGFNLALTAGLRNKLAA